ncbi:MAG: inorganic diphosphatase [Candidatus Puniceispirillaceae bacterium]
MNIEKLAVGKNPPEDVNVIIEIPAGSSPVKYEVDKDSGALLVDRFVHTAMHYPVNYGFVPHTLSDDGDPIDACVLTPMPVVHGSVIAARPIGVLMMEDESGLDEKLLCVPVDKLHPLYKDVKEATDLQPVILEQIGHFFEHYKDLEKGKWVKVQGWEGSAKAAEMITQAIARAAAK